MPNDHKAWTSNPQWVDSISRPFIDSDRLQYLRITGGPGWTPGDYLIRDLYPSQIPSTSGNMAYLDLPPAPAGASDGIATVLDLSAAGTAGQCVLAGNSQGTRVQYAYCARMANLLNPFVNPLPGGSFPANNVAYRVRQYQTPNKTTAQFLTDGTNYAALYDNALPASKEYFVYSEIINDLRFGATGQQAYDNMVAFLTPIKAAGFRVIIHAPTFRNDGGTPIDYETHRAFVLAKLRADFNVAAVTATDSQYVLLAKVGGNGYGDVLIDIAADNAFDIPGAGDGVHWNESQAVRAADLTYQGLTAAPPLAGITVTHDAVDGSGNYQFHAAPVPSGASLAGLAWSVSSLEGTIGGGGLFADIAKPATRNVVITASVGSVSQTSTLAVPGTDTIAPTISSLVVGTDGLSGTISLSESCTGTTGFTFAVAGTTRTGVVTGGETVASATRNVAFASVVYQGQTVTYSYAGDGLTDAGGNHPGAVTGISATNNSTVTQPLPVVATPTFSPVAGTALTVGDEVEGLCATAGAALRYTLTTDNSTPADPTSASPLYSTALVAGVAGTLKIKLRGFKTGMADSAVASAAYTVSAPQSGGGSGGVQLVQGPLQLTASEDQDGEPLRFSKGERRYLALTLRDGDGRPLPIGETDEVSVTITDKTTGDIVTDNAGVLVVLRSEGRINYRLQQADTEEARDIRLSVAVTQAGVGGDVVVFGPRLIEVRER